MRLVRTALSESHVATSLVQDAMIELCDSWQTSYTQHIVTLYLQKQGYPRIYWRTTSAFFGMQQTVDLFGSDLGTEVVSELKRSEDLFLHAMRCESKRIDLNYDMRVARSQEEAARTRDRALINLSSFRRIAV